MRKDTQQEIREEVEEIAEKTRVVPVTMLLSLAVLLGLLGLFTFSVYNDTDDGTLDDPQGVIDEETLETMKDVSPLD